VTLVGIVLADLSLFLPDFRSAERTFQLLTQVAGRAGRGTVPGDVYIQTYAPNNPAIQYAVRNDYDGFFQEEFEIRKKFGYPPCLRMAIVHFKGPDSLLVAKFADEFLEALRPFIPAGMLVSGPSPSPLEKVKNYYRYMIMLRGQLTAEFRSYLKDRIIRQKRPKDVYVYTDIDPLNLM
ncbi:MAG: primosomal protein N', partial [Candidatus Nanoarchaeia archaeon]